jgi:hypothetical protein
MSDWKNFLLSRTVWANTIGLTALVLASFGFRPSGIDTDQLVDVILQVIAGISFLASTVFRVLATRKLTL